MGAQRNAVGRDKRENHKSAKENKNVGKPTHGNECPYAKKCGGCDYQGMAYEKQLQQKQHLRKQRPQRQLPQSQQEQVRFII